MTTSETADRRVIWWKDPGDGTWKKFVERENDVLAAYEARVSLVERDSYYEVGKTVLILPVDQHPDTELAPNPS